MNSFNCYGNAEKTTKKKNDTVYLQIHDYNALKQNVQFNIIIIFYLECKHDDRLMLA